AGERELAPDALVGVDTLGHRCRLGETGGLDDHGVELLAVFHELEEAAHQIAADRAADAAIVHLHTPLIGGKNQIMANSHPSEPITTHANPAAVLGGQYAVEQRGFS